MRRNITKTILTTLCCLFSAVSVSAQIFCQGQFEFEVTDNLGAVAVRPVNKSECKDTVVIPGRVTHNGKYYTVTTIADFAFEGCRYLTSVTIPSTVEKLGNSSFSGCGLTAVHIPISVKKIGFLAFSNTPLEFVSVAKDNPYLDSRGNCNAIIETESDKLILGTTKTRIPETVTVIGRGAFYNRTDLTSITIPNSVKTIAPDAFSFCIQLSKIYSKMMQPAQVFHFDDKLYRDCTLYIPAGTRKVYSSTKPWSYFRNIKEIDYEATGIENVSKDDIKVFAADGYIQVKGSYGVAVEVYRTDGKMVYRGKNRSIPVGRGAYIVRVAGKTFKVSC